MNPILEQISKVGLVPVVKLKDPEKAALLAEALDKGGIPVAEITFRAEGADRAIRKIATELPHILVGAGTVINIEQVKAAVDAGAKYIISPGFDREVVEYCVKNNIPVTPGCTNPSEVSVATNLGLEVVKFFPAEASGGLKVLKALAGPFPKMRFIPTGGVSPANLNDYLSFGKIIACGGSWMVPEDLVDNNDWDGITSLARQAVFGMLSPSFEHIAINNPSDSSAEATAKMLQALLCAEPKANSNGYMVTDRFEVMKPHGRGTNGHIAISVNSVERAMYQYQRMGIEFDMDTLKLDDAGKPKFVYFKDEIGGFAVHLMLKK